MSDATEELVWLVERSYGNDEDLVTLVYATTDGARHLRKQLAPNLVRKKEITAGRHVSTDKLEDVSEQHRQERYATEATRMASEHDPDTIV